MTNVNEIINALKEELNAEVTTQDIVKAGDKTLTGIIIRPTTGTNISPTIYLWDGYESEPLEDVVDKILMQYEKYKVKETINIDFITDWNKAKGKILTKLMNPVTNEKYLADKVTYPYVDLAAVFYIPVFENESEGQGSVVVRKDFLEKWGVTAEEIFNTAVENTRKEVMIEDMMEMFKVMGMPIPENDPNIPMIILSNKTKVAGAGVLPSALDEISERYGKCYIIPSSVHEMIIIPDDGNGDVDALNAMINDVNIQCLSDEDYLSNHAYYFDGTEVRVA